MKHHHHHTCSPREAADPRLAELFTLIGQQDEAAMCELHRLTSGPLLRYIRRIVRNLWDSEEVLQDVYRFVWQRAQEYTEARGVPMAWLFMVARSRALDNLRSTSRVAVRTVSGDAMPHCGGPDPEETWQRSLFEQEVRSKLSGLPPAQRSLIQLAFYEGYSHGDIAEMTGVPLGTVKTRIRNALRDLRQAMPPGHFCRRRGEGRS